MALQSEHDRVATLAAGRLGELVGWRLHKGREATPWVTAALSMARRQNDARTEIRALAIMGTIGLDQSNLKEFLELAERYYTDDWYAIGRLLHEVAVAKVRMGHYDSAEDDLGRARALLTQPLGPEHPRVAATLSVLSQAQMGADRFSDALSTAQQALELRKAALGPQHPQVGASLQSLGDLYRDHGEPQAAVPFYQKALEAYQGDSPAAAAETWSRLCLTYDVGQSPNKALAACEQATETAKVAWKTDAPAWADLSAHHAHVLYALGKAEQALPLARDALDRLEKRRDVDPNALVSARLLVVLVRLAQEGTPADPTELDRIERALDKIEPDSPETELPVATRAGATFARAQLLWHRGSRSEAQAKLAEAQQLLDAKQWQQARLARTIARWQSTMQPPT